RPEWIECTILTNVADELKRAHRDEEAAAFYREAVDSSQTVEAINNALQLAADRGDVDGCLALFEKFVRVLGNRTQAIVQGVADPLDALTKVMAARAIEEDYAGILHVADRYLELF